MTSSVQTQSQSDSTLNHWGDVRRLNVSFSCWAKWAGFDRCLIPFAFEWWIGNAKRRAREWKLQQLNGALLSAAWPEQRVRLTVQLARTASPVTWWYYGSVSLSCIIRVMLVIIWKITENKAKLIVFLTTFDEGWILILSILLVPIKCVCSIKTLSSPHILIFESVLLSDTLHFLI